MTPTVHAAELEAVLRAELPAADFMGLRVAAWDAHGLEITAAEAPNQNIHGTAFGGSLASLSLLAGWGLVWVRLREAGRPGELVVQRLEADYQAPVRGGIHARAARPAPEEWARFTRTLERRGKARIRVSIQAWGDAGAGEGADDVGAAFTAWYVASRASTEGGEG